MRKPLLRIAFGLAVGALLAWIFFRISYIDVAIMLIAAAAAAAAAALANALRSRTRPDPGVFTPEEIDAFKRQGRP